LGWLARCAGVGLCTAAVAGWLSLLTWSVTDPSLTHATSAETHNLVGRLGAIVSDLLLQLLGLAAVFVLWAPIAWGGELLLTERLARFRLKVCLLPLSVLAIAAGAAALRTPASWPFEQGFGGLLGDVTYNLMTSLLSLLVPEPTGRAAGLALLAGGFAGFTHTVGANSRNRVRLWRGASERGWRRRIESGWLRQRHGALQLRPSARREPIFDVEFPHPQRDAAVDSLEPVAPPPNTLPVTASQLGDDASPGTFPGQDAVAFEADFDIDSRAIAERFAPRVRGQPHRLARAAIILWGHLPRRWR
jgi:S-DNA-T family DNA segregation ATPase FtsK/SpoIIIE